MVQLKNEYIKKVLEESDPAKLTWAQIYYEIAKKLNLLQQEGTLFQYVSLPTVAAWTDDVQYNVYNIANPLPASSGPFYTASDKDLDSTYRSFLVSIAPKDATVDSHYKEVEKEHTLALSTQTNNSEKALKIYRAWAQNPTDPDIKSYTAWLNSSASGPWKNTIANDQSMVDYYWGLMQAYTKGSPMLIDYLNDYNDIKNYDDVTTPSGTPIHIHMMDITPNLSSQLKDWKDGLGTGLSIDTKTSTSDPSVWNMINYDNVDFSKFFGPYSKSCEVTYQNVYMDHEFQLQITIGGIAEFSISRPNWYHGDALDIFKEGPYLDKDMNETTFFGKNGLLVLVPKSVLVAYGISATLTISDTTYSQYKESWETSYGFKIGPFEIKTGGSSGSMTVTHNQNNTTTLKINDNSQLPMVIGVQSILRNYC